MPRTTSGTLSRSMNVDTAAQVGYEPRFLPALSDDERKALMSGAIVRNFSAGAALFHENQLADRVLVVRRRGS